MDTHQRIIQLLKERNWSEYKLAKESGLSQSTISNLFNRNTTPSIPTLEAICRGLGITLSQFFAEGHMVELSNEQKQFFDDWVMLSAEDKVLVQKIVEKFK